MVCASNMKETLTFGITLICVSSRRQFTRDALVLTDDGGDLCIRKYTLHMSVLFGFVAFLLLLLVFFLNFWSHKKKKSVKKKKKTSKHFSEVLKYIYGCD